MSRLILATQSKRRVEILRNAGVEFEAIPSNFDETSIPNFINPVNVVVRLAREKASVVAKSHPHNTVIGCDTIMVFDGIIRGKPKDEEQFDKWWNDYISSNDARLLFYTGYAVIKQSYIATDHNLTSIFFDTFPVKKEVFRDNILPKLKNSSEYPIDCCGGYGNPILKTCSLIDEGTWDNASGLDLNSVEYCMSRVYDSLFNYLKPNA